MKRDALGVVLIVGCALFFVNGCAKKELVRKDEPAAAAAMPAVKSDAAGEKPMHQESARVVPEKEMSAPVSRAGELKLALQTIYFDFDAYTLSPQARTTLERNAGILKKEPTVRVRVEGNCDERGSDEYNLALGERRASTAMQYLVTLGVPAERLSVISFGEEKPVDPGHDEAAWAKNRRADFMVIK